METKKFIGNLSGAVGRRGPLGGLFVQPTWETTYRREFRANQERRKRLENVTNLRMIDKLTVLIRFVPPREKLRLCENQSRLMKPPASRPNLYYKQYEQKYWK